MIKKAMISIISILTLAGCSLHKPNSIEPSVEMPSHFNGTAEMATTASRDQMNQEAWWKVFNDPVLDKYVEQVLENNLSVKQAYARLDQMNALLTQAGGARLPQLSASGQANRGKSLSQFGSFTGESSGVSLAAGYEIDLWGKLKAQQEAGRLNFEASRKDIESIYLSLSAQTADLYLLLIERREQLELARKTLRAREETFDLVKRRYQEGLVTALDIYQAEQAKVLAETKIPQIERDIQTTSHALSVLMGAYPESSLETKISKIPQLDDWFPSGLPSDLLLNRPDIQAELKRLEASDQNIAVAIANRFPSLNLLGEYGHSRTDYGMSMSGTVWSILGSLTGPIWDWGIRKAEVERQTAVFEERLYHYQESVLNAFVEVENALVNHKTTTELETLQEHEIRAARSAYELARDQYRDGLTSYLPVLNAEASLYDAESRQVSTKKQLLTHRISLVRALGGTWMQTRATHSGMED